MSPVALLIPHYNNQKGLEHSLASVEEHIPIDAVVVDDGSDLPPAEDNLQDCFTAGRLKLLTLKTNSGIENALNTGLAYIRNKGYRYVARLDCGDVNAEGRLGLQKNYLDAHPDVRLVGSYVEFIDPEKNQRFTYKVPEAHYDIKKKMHVKVMFIHPSVMFRTDIVDEIGYYPTTYPAAEDYAYFFRIVKKYETANIPEVLVRCEWNATGISARKRQRQLRSKFRILIKYFHLGMYPILGLLITIGQMMIPARWIGILKTKLSN